MSKSPMQFGPPVTWYDRLVTEHGLWEDCEGIPLAVIGLVRESAIRTRVADALRLIAANAPSDFGRIRTLMRGILVARLHGSRGEWRQGVRVCILSSHYISVQKPSAYAIAATIVHELAHARLDALGIGSADERAGRIERVCFRASERFLRALPASSERDAVLAEVEEYLGVDTAIWTTLWRRDYRPWHVRVLAYSLRRIGDIWHRMAPT